MSRAPWLSAEERLAAFEELCAHREAATGTDAERAGRVWYEQAFDHCSAFSLAHGVTLPVAAAVVAVLSPQKSWAQNLKLAEVCLSGERPRTMGRAADLACKIRDTGETKHLSGRKVTAFYFAIMGIDCGPVIDRWMARACGLETDRLSPKQYGELADVVREAAESFGEDVHTFQAIVWCQIRGKAE